MSEKRRPPLHLSAYAAAALLAACSGTPQNAALQDAHRSYDAAAAEPNVMSAAASDMRAARTYLDSADTALAKGADQREITHRAYMAQQQVNIAMEDAKLKQMMAQGRRPSTPSSMAARGSIHFASSNATIAPGTETTIARAATFLKQNPDQRVRIEGYTDSSGNQTQNVALSQQRADAVRDTLVAQGVDASRIEAHGNGDADPVASNSTAEGRQMNRRVVVVISNMPRAESSSSQRAPAAMSVPLSEGPGAH